MTLIDLERPGCKGSNFSGESSQTLLCSYTVGFKTNRLDMVTHAGEMRISTGSATHPSHPKGAGRSTPQFWGSPLSIYAYTFGRTTTNFDVVTHGFVFTGHHHHHHHHFVCSSKKKQAHRKKQSKYKTTWAGQQGLIRSTYNCPKIILHTNNRNAHRNISA